jgi:metal-responsive CopG/Arc/MetJ family transcriptional regulator
MGKQVRPLTKSEPRLRGKLRPLMVSLPPELVDQIDEAAANEHRSRTNMIEVMIRDWLADHRPNKPRQKTQPAALHAERMVA